MVKKYTVDRYYQICASFGTHLQYIQNNIDQIDPRKSQESNVRNLRVIRSRVDDVRTLVADWKPFKSDMKSLKIATISRLDDCIRWLDAFIETGKTKQLYETMRNLAKIYDHFRGSYV